MIEFLYIFARVHILLNKLIVDGHIAREASASMLLSLNNLNI